LKKLACRKVGADILFLFNNMTPLRVFLPHHERIRPGEVTPLGTLRSNAIGKLDSM